MCVGSENTCKWESGSLSNCSPGFLYSNKILFCSNPNSLVSYECVPLLSFLVIEYISAFTHKKKPKLEG